MLDMDFTDNHGVLPVESRKTPPTSTSLGSRPSSKICCPALGHESASGTPTTGDRSEASPKPDTGHSSSAEPAASSPRPIRFRHPDFG
ncbi:hypothetical protein CRENBAI_004519 [Crenichthys baileyi]|uniref:Uncharacterized protein n=1 Tax=Crenichthys baileyi TaxID=28760 RepID=A0AAV9R1D3_9TELE